MVPLSVAATDTPPDGLIAILITLGLIFLAHTIPIVWCKRAEKKEKELEKNTDI